MELFYLCLKIFLGRTTDVSLGTVRTIMTVKGKNILAAFIGFFEVSIWFLIVNDALNNEFNSLWIVAAYAGGYAMGTYVGGQLAKKFIKSKLSIQIIIHEEHAELIPMLREKGYAVSVLRAKGAEESNRLMLFLEIDSHLLENLKRIVKEYDEKAFIVVNETKYVENGYFRNVAK